MVSNDAALRAPFGGYALFFSNQTTRPPIISNKWYGQGLHWFSHCCHLPLGKVKTLALACNYRVSGLFVARLRPYQHLDRASNGSSLGLAKLTRVELASLPNLREISINPLLASVTQIRVMSAVAPSHYIAVFGLYFIREGYPSLFLNIRFSQSMLGLRRVSHC